MVIETIDLSSFRLYKKNSFSFSSSVTIVVGPNAAGKTNLLEAIFFLAAGKSFRAEKDRETIAFGKELARVKGEMLDSIAPSTSPLQNDNKTELEIVLTGGEVMGVKAPIKKFLVNGISKRRVDFVGKLKAVLFWPQDLQLVTDSPSLRRRYLDFVLTQVDREYRRSLISYEKGLRQRNRLLEAIRDEGKSRDQLMFWDRLLIKNGKYITEKREEYIDFVNKFKVKSEKLKVINYQLVYDRSVISTMRLGQYSREEVAAGATLVGPHRDDVKFKVNNRELRDLSNFGSRGEQRLAVLWLKLGELAFIEEKTGEKPVLLLDDILSELDQEHRKIIFDIVGKQQTIITTTDEQSLDKSLRLSKIIKL